MPGRRGSVYEETEINLTPLIDCVFLLLVFFMVTTVFKQPYSLRVDLPEAKKATMIEEKNLVGTITAAGEIEINRRRVGMDQLAEILRQEKQSTGSLTFTLRTDKTTRHGLVLDTMEIAKFVGVEKIVLATEKKKEE